MDKIKKLESTIAVKDDIIVQMHSQNHLFEVSQNSLVTKTERLQCELEEALAKIKVLQSRCAENEDALRQKEAAQHELIQKLAQMARAQLSSCDAPSSPRLNAFDDFNSDLKLQVEAGRTLIDAIRQQLGDERERVAVLQKQLAREKEQVRVLGALLCLRMVVSSFCFSERRASAAAHFVRGNTELTGAQAALGL